MYFTFTTHGLFLASAILGTLVLGHSLGRRQTWATLLLYAVPVVLAVSVSDLGLALLSTTWPEAALDGGPGDRLRFAVVFLVVLFPCEIVHQLAMTTLVDRRVAADETARASAAEDEDEQTDHDALAGKRPPTDPRSVSDTGVQDAE